MELSTQQADRLTRAHSEIGGVLKDLGLIEQPQRPPEPQWLRAPARQWRLPTALPPNHRGDASSQECSRLGRQHGYAPRGLGGTCGGAKPLMKSDGDRRILTEYGSRFLERWRED